MYARDLFYIKKCKQNKKNKKKKLLNGLITIFFHDHELVHWKFYEKYLRLHFILLLFVVIVLFVFLLYHPVDFKPNILPLSIIVIESTGCTVHTRICVKLLKKKKSKKQNQK